jgi:hypothetical protein
MIRESLAAKSRQAMVDVEPVTSTGIEFIWRTNTAGNSTSASATGLIAPYWIRLTRTNNTFQAYRSPDGSAWTLIGSAVTLSMSNSAYVGLAVCAHTTTTLGTAVFDSVAASFLTNVPPVISWSAPTNNQVFIRSNSITLTATASDSDGSVSNVTFFNGPTPLGTVTTGYANRYSLIWSNVPAGGYSLTAVATDNSGVTNTSPAVIGISVVPPPPANLHVVSGPQGNGQFSLNFQGYANQSYVLLASTNLVNWLPIQTNLTTANGLVTFTDLNATGSAKFYRVAQ